MSAPLTGIYRADYGTLQEGQEGEIAINPDHTLVVGGGGGGQVTIGATDSALSSSLASSGVGSATPVMFSALNGRLDSTTPTGTYYVLVMDAASLPSNGAVTRIVTAYKINHTSGFDDFFNLDYSSGPKETATGVVWAISSTEFTLTLAAGALASATTSFFDIPS